MDQQTLSSAMLWVNNLEKADEEISSISTFSPGEKFNSKNKNKNNKNNNFYENKNSSSSSTQNQKLSTMQLLCLSS
jgi:hypothetical protein